MFQAVEPETANDRSPNLSLVRSMSYSSSWLQNEGVHDLAIMCVKKMKIGLILKKSVFTQQDKCRERHVLAAINDSQRSKHIQAMIRQL